MFFNLSGDLPGPRDSRAARLCRYESLKLSFHPVKFGGNRYCGCGDITFLDVEGQDSTCSLKSTITVCL